MSVCALCDQFDLDSSNRTGQLKQKRCTEQGGQALRGFQELGRGHSIAVLLVDWDIGVGPLDHVEEGGSWGDSWSCHGVFGVICVKIVGIVCIVNAREK